MEKFKSLLKDILSIGVSVAIITFVLLNFVLMPVLVNGTSMYPTLKPDDYGYSFKITRKFGINRFDIVVINVEGDDSKLLVKRVIGMPNEEIEYLDNKLYVNGEFVEEEFLDDECFTADFSYQLGEDEYFVLGDNRMVSRDSRYYGAFSSDLIMASHVLVLFPFADMGVKR